MAKTEEWQIQVETKYKNKSETNNIDFKRDLTEDAERLKEHINAFGNTVGGGLFVFGVNRDYSFYDQDLNQDAIAEKIASIANDSQVPPLRTVVHHIKLSDKTLLAVEICPGS
jgi:predicted HTH transcriptional regulator